MTTDDAPAPPDASQPDRKGQPRPTWARHPLIKYPTFLAIGVGVAGQRFLNGQTETLLTGVCALVIFPVAIASSVALMRGTAPPLTGSQFRLISPIAVIFFSASFLVVATVMVLDTLLANGDRSSLTLAGLWFGAAIFVLGLILQIGSWSDQWPDRWHPPYARRGAPAPPADDERGA